jgi:CheY-like chemotaxis protein
MAERPVLLIVEDDHDTRVSLRRILEAEGYTVYSAGNGVHAIDILKKIPIPSLILMDLMMPVMNGQEFYGQLKSHASWRAIPVIVISAFTNEATRLIASAFLQKPLDLDALLGVIRERVPPFESAGEPANAEEAGTASDISDGVHAVDGTVDPGRGLLDGPAPNPRVTH